MEQFNPSDKITLDVPLFIRLLEYAREDAKTDMDLHKVAENAIALSETGKTLTMGQYDAIVKDGGQEDASYANMANENRTINESKHMKTQLNEIKRMQQLAGLITEQELANPANYILENENSQLSSTASGLYDKISLSNKIDTYGMDINDTMEDIIKKVGYTPEQKNIKGPYKFAKDLPQFETLTDLQLQAIIPFLNAVIKRGGFSAMNNSWNGKRITED